MECYLLNEPKIRGYIKRILGLWLQKGMFWVSEQVIMTELEIDEQERKVTGSDSVIVKVARSAEALPDHVEDVRNFLPEMEAEEQADSLEEEAVATVIEIAK